MSDQKTSSAKLKATLEDAYCAIGKALSRVHPDGTVLGIRGFEIDLSDAEARLAEARRIALRNHQEEDSNGR